LIVHTAKWQKGALVDLGSLPGNTSSCPDWISGNGLVVGPSENGTIDPLTGWPAIEAVLWRNGQLINLGTLGGNESFPISVNNRGQVAGEAVLSNGDIHAVLLIPCGKGETGCDAAANSRVNATPNIPTLTIRSLSNSIDRRLTYGEMLAAWRARLATQPTRH
jgi:uncharacterized membrane protein